MLKCLPRGGENKNDHFFLSAGLMVGNPDQGSPHLRDPKTMSNRRQRVRYCADTMVSIHSARGGKCFNYDDQRYCQYWLRDVRLSDAEIILPSHAGLGLPFREVRSIPVAWVWMFDCLHSAWLGECCVANGRHHSIVGSRRCSYVSWFMLGWLFFFLIFNVDPFLYCFESGRDIEFFKSLKLTW